MKTTLFLCAIVSTSAIVCMEEQEKALTTTTIPRPLSSSTLNQKYDVLGDNISGITLTRVSGSDLEIVNAARVSYGKESFEVRPADAKLIKFLMEHHHTSPFEHNQLSFRVKAPIFVARQWFRHRMNSFNEISARYVEVLDEFYVPTQWRSQDKRNKQASAESFDNEMLTTKMKESYAQCAETYKLLLENGVCRELARAVLPVATYTEFIFTCNLHSFMHFINLRLDAGAQWEIRKYAKKMLQLALPHFPIALKEWTAIHGTKLNLTEDTFTDNFSKTAL